MLRKIFTILCLFSVLLLNSQSIGELLHATHYEIHLDEVNSGNNTIKAHTSTWITPLQEDVSVVKLELINLDVDSVFIDNTLVAFEYNDGIISVALAETLNIDDTIVMAVYYQGQPFHESWGGYHFAGDYSFNLGVGFVSIPHNLGKAWFPCIDDFTDRATYDLFATVDNNLTAIGGGILIETIDNGNGSSSWHWKMNQNIPTYLESVTIGGYVLTADEYFGIADTIPINVYTRPQEVSKVEGTFVNLKEITRFFEDHFGPYPFDRIGFSGTALGAMEHATNISYPHSGINGGTSSEWWYTHELSHMWFGDMITCSTAEDMWINEGWATFCQIFYLEGLYDMEEYTVTMRDKHKEVLLKTHHIDNGYYAVSNIPQEYTYGSTAYDKGAVVTNALRTYLSDSIFYDAVTAMLQNFAFQSISSYDMRDFMTNHTGINMDGFFDSWVFTAGTPHYSIDSTIITQNESNYTIDIYPKQKHKGVNHIGNDNIVQIAYLKEDFEFVFDTLHFSGETGHSTKQLDFLPISVIIDPLERMMDATTDNFMVFDSPQDYVFPDTYFKILLSELENEIFVQATHNWVSPDSLKEDVLGLKLSDARYWTINGDIPESTIAQGRFYYDNSLYLDNDLISSETDSVVILYRENSNDEWHFIPQTRMGIWSVGFIVVDQLKKGEYTLAIMDLTVMEDEIILDSNYKIYPKPSKGTIKFDFPETGNYLVKIIDSRGITIDSLSFNGKRKKWNPRINNLNTNSCLIYIYNNGKLVSVEKMIFID